MADQESQLEPHPFRHNWHKTEDHITARNSRKRVIEVRRHEWCSYCAVERRTRVDTNVWEVMGKPYYRRPKGYKVNRISRAKHLRETFSATSNLAEVRELGR